MSAKIPTGGGEQDLFLARSLLSITIYYKSIVLLKKIIYENSRLEIMFVWCITFDAVYISDAFKNRCSQLLPDWVISHEQHWKTKLCAFDNWHTCTITLPSQETPKRVLLQTAKTQMKCSIMLHFIRVYTVWKGKKIFSQKNTICFWNYNLPPLDRHNGLSQVYCIKQEGIIH